MKILLMFILALAACGLRAQAVKIEATVLQVSGRVFSYEGPAGQALRIGQMLVAGARVVTQEKSTAKLLLADGSSLVLGENTDLLLTEMTQDQASYNILFQVFRGLIKATVNKLTVGSRFELHTAHGVAAVKGTEYIAQVDADQTVLSVREGRVMVEDLRHERRQEIGAGRQGRCMRQGLGEVRRLDGNEMELLLRHWGRVGAERRADRQAARAAAVAHAQSEASAEEEAQRLTEASWRSSQRSSHWLRRHMRVKAAEAVKEALGETWDDITQLKEEERRDKWRERMRQADEYRLAGNEAQVDFMLGKTLMDVHGVKVRMQEFLIRDDAKTLRFLNYSKRENRLDAYTASHTYNKDLPEKLAGVRGLGKKEWEYAPEYWVVHTNLTFLNRSADTLTLDNDYFDPVQTGFNQRRRWELIEKSRLLKANGVVLEQWRRYQTSGAGAVTAIRPWGADMVPNQAALPVAGDMGSNRLSLSLLSQTEMLLDSGKAYQFGWSPETYARAIRPGSGDLAWVTHVVYGDGTSWTVRNWSIDENGKVRNWLDLAQKSAWQAYLDLAFKTYTELQVTSSLFTDPEGIDCVSQMNWWGQITRQKDDL
jgi:hypothetical protein